MWRALRAVEGRGERAVERRRRARSHPCSPNPLMTRVGWPAQARVRARRAGRSRWRAGSVDGRVRVSRERCDDEAPVEVAPAQVLFVGGGAASPAVLRRDGAPLWESSTARWRASRCETRRGRSNEDDSIRLISAPKRASPATFPSSGRTRTTPFSWPRLMPRSASRRLRPPRRAMVGRAGQ